jgi:hypothetical protein
MEKATEDDLITYMEAAQICGWRTVQPVQRLIRMGHLPMVKITHKSRRIRRGDLENWLASRTVRKPRRKG